MKVRNDDIVNEKIASGGVFAPAIDTTSQSFIQWIEAISKFQEKDISDLYCVIRLRRERHHPSCYLVLSENHSNDSLVLSDKKVIGKSFSWPDSFINVPDEEMAEIVKSDAIEFSRRCNSNDCLFKHAKGVVVSHHGNKYQAVNFK